MAKKSEPQLTPAQHRSFDVYGIWNDDLKRWHYMGEMDVIFFHTAYPHVAIAVLNEIRRERPKFSASLSVQRILSHGLPRGYEIIELEGDQREMRGSLEGDGNE